MGGLRAAVHDTGYLGTNVREGFAFLHVHFHVCFCCAQQSLHGTILCLVFLPASIGVPTVDAWLAQGNPSFRCMDGSAAPLALVGLQLGIPGSKHVCPGVVEQLAFPGRERMGHHAMHTRPLSPSVVSRWTRAVAAMNLHWLGFSHHQVSLLPHPFRPPVTGHIRPRGSRSGRLPSRRFVFASHSGFPFNRSFLDRNVFPFNPNRTPFRTVSGVDSLRRDRSFRRACTWTSATRVRALLRLLASVPASCDPRER